MTARPLTNTPLSNIRTLTSTRPELALDAYASVACPMGCSIGVAFYPNTAQEIKALMAAADSAMYASTRQRDGGAVAAAILS